MTTDPMMVEVAWCPGTFSGNGHPMRPTCDQPGSECVVAHVPQVRRGIVAPGSRTALVLALGEAGLAVAASGVRMPVEALTTKEQGKAWIAFGQAALAAHDSGKEGGKE